MQKKIIFFTLLALSTANNVLVKAEEQIDKYAEWCKNLELNKEQKQKLSLYLDQCKRIFTQEKLKAYHQAMLENQAPQDKFSEDIEAQIFWSRTLQMGSDPVLAKTLVQMFFLTGLDETYLISNEELLKASSETNVDSIDFEEIAKFFEQIEKSIDSCKACHKFHDKE